MTRQIQRSAPRQILRSLRYVQGLSGSHGDARDMSCANRKRAVRPLQRCYRDWLEVKEGVHVCLVSQAWAGPSSPSGICLPLVGLEELNALYVCAIDHPCTSSRTCLLYPLFSALTLGLWGKAFYQLIGPRLGSSLTIWEAEGDPECQAYRSETLWIKALAHLTDSPIKTTPLFNVDLCRNY